MDLDPNQAERVQRALSELNSARPPWKPDRQARGAIQEVADFLSGSVDRLRAISVDANRVIAAFGLPVTVVTLARAAEFAELSSLVGTPTPPEGQWLNPTVQAALDVAARILGELLADFRARRDALRAVFTEDVLALDLNALNVRFTEVHRGLRKLFGAYRQDKRTLAACTVAGRVDRTVLARLPEAAAWQDLSSKLSTAESQHAHLIGEHYHQRGDADFDRISSAIEVAHWALKLVDPVSDPCPRGARVRRVLLGGVGGPRRDFLDQAQHQSPDLVINRWAAWTGGDKSIVW